MGLLRGFFLLAVFLAACNGTVTGTTTTDVTISTTLFPTTTSTSTTTSTTTPTTTLLATVDVDHEFRVYEGFEATANFEEDQPCLTVGEINPVRAGGRVTVWNDVGDSIFAGGKLSSGTIQYDETGPAIGDDGSDLFYFCSFWVTFRDLPQGEAFRFEYPGEEELSGITTTEDLVGGAFTSYTTPNSETERQRIRAEQ